MSLNKKEQAEFAALRRELAVARALRFTDPVARDVEIPKAFEEIANGWDYHVSGWDSCRVEKACTSTRTLYSTELRATLAGRSELAQRCANVLADVDARIEALRAKADGGCASS